MGHIMTRLLQKRRETVLMLGLKNSGKTTILYKLLTGKKILSVPTFGFNMEILPFNDIELDVMDVGGGEKMVPLWKHYLITAAAIVYVLDCNDWGRMNENKELIEDILSRPERKGVPLLVIVNKAENMTRPMTSGHFQEKLDLNSNTRGRKYKVQFVSAETGTGVVEAFTWLCAVLGSGHASRKIKRLREKEKKKGAVRAKKKKHEEIEKKQKAVALTKYTSRKSVDVSTSLEAARRRSGSCDSINERQFSFPDIRSNIQDFFVSRVGDGVENLNRSRGHSKVEVTPPSDGSHVVDTLSTNPHDPQYERRPGSMLRINELKEKRDMALAKKNDAEQIQTEGGWDKIRRLFIRPNAMNESDQQQTVSKINPSEQKVEDSNSVELGQSTACTSQVSDNESEQIRQEGLNQKVIRLPSPDIETRKMKRIIRRQIKSTSGMEFENSPRIKASAINRQRILMRNTANYKTESPRTNSQGKRYKVVRRKVKVAAETTVLQTAQPIEKQATRSPRSMRGGVWSVIASIRFSFPLGRNTQRHQADTDISVGDSTFHVTSSNDDFPDTNHVMSVMELNDHTPSTSSEMTPERNYSTEIITSA
nr:ADP-ribosylation factor-like protein 13B [Ciona intestinalis]|eukprot:XP_002130365.1 ADP-ribosylation factor-like protein 13B [Ciona intestinalis]